MLAIWGKSEENVKEGEQSVCMASGLTHYAKPEIIMAWETCSNQATISFANKQNNPSFFG